MKNSKVLSELKKEARNSGSESIKEVLKLGKSYWFRGCPIDAPDDLVALRLVTGVIIRVNEKDIIDVKKDKGIYMVQVKEGTHALASFQMLTSVDSSAESCNCGDTNSESEAKQLQSNSLSGTGFDDIFQPPMLGAYICYNEPYFTMKCYRYQDKCGKWHTFCIPDIGYRLVCKWI